jgi:hypothetical protein
MTTRVIIAALTVLAFVAGCGGSKTGPSSSPTQQAPQSQQTPAGLVVAVTISNGAVTPANAEFEAKVGQPIHQCW